MQNHINSQKLRILEGKTEVNESCFRGRSKGKHGRGARNKVSVLSLLKNGDSIVYIDSFRSYNALDAFLITSLLHLSIALPFMVITENSK